MTVAPPHRKARWALAAALVALISGGAAVLSQPGLETEVWTTLEAFEDGAPGATCVHASAGGRLLNSDEWYFTGAGNSDGDNNPVPAEIWYVGNATVRELVRELVAGDRQIGETATERWYAATPCHVWRHGTTWVRYVRTR